MGARGQATEAGRTKLRQVRGQSKEGVRGSQRVVRHDQRGPITARAASTRTAEGVAPALAAVLRVVRFGEPRRPQMEAGTRDRPRSTGERHAVVGVIECGGGAVE